MNVLEITLNKKTARHHRLPPPSTNKSVYLCLDCIQRERCFQSARACVYTTNLFWEPKAAFIRQNQTPNRRLTVLPVSPPHTTQRPSFRKEDHTKTRQLVFFLFNTLLQNKYEVLVTAGGIQTPNLRLNCGVLCLRSYVENRTLYGTIFYGTSKPWVGMYAFVPGV